MKHLFLSALTIGGAVGTTAATQLDSSKVEQINKTVEDGLTLGQELAPHTPLIGLCFMAATFILHAWHSYAMQKIAKNK